MLEKLTHPHNDHELWVDLDEIVAMERFNRPKTTLQLPNEQPEYTALVLKCGKVISCVETPQQIYDMKGTEY